MNRFFSPKKLIQIYVISLYLNFIADSRFSSSSNNPNRIFRGLAPLSLPSKYLCISFPGYHLNSVPTRKTYSVTVIFLLRSPNGNHVAMEIHSVGIRWLIVLWNLVMSNSLEKGSYFELWYRKLVESEVEII